MAKDRGLVTREAFSNSIDKNLSAEFRQLAKDTRIPMSKLLDEAIEMLLEKYRDK